MVDDRKGWLMQGAGLGVMEDRQRGACSRVAGVAAQRDARGGPPDGQALCRCGRCMRDVTRPLHKLQPRLWCDPIHSPPSTTPAPETNHKREEQLTASSAGRLRRNQGCCRMAAIVMRCTRSRNATQRTEE